VEFHTFANSKGVGFVIRRDGPTFGQIPLNLGVILRIKPQKETVVGRDRMSEAHCLFSVAIVCRGFMGKRESQDSPILRFFLGPRISNQSIRNSDYAYHYPRKFKLNSGTRTAFHDIPTSSLFLNSNPENAYSRKAFPNKKGPREIAIIPGTLI
jgi:hypothetical protein